MSESVALMDRPLKERLVGACILVATVVIVVPELLSGPARRPPPAPADGNRRLVEIDLNTRQTTASVPTQDPQLASSGIDNEAAPAANLSEPRAATPSAAQAASAAQSSGAAQGRGAAQGSSAAPPSGVSMPLENASSGPTSMSRSTTELSARTAWSVQVGSFANRANAERLVHQLKSSGATAYLLSSGSGSRQRYRVRVGPLADRGAAERTVTRLKALGHAATVVAPGAAG